jgi:hypothetical protein
MGPEIAGNVIGGLICAGVLGLVGIGWRIGLKVGDVLKSQRRTEYNLFVIVGWLKEHEQTLDRHEVAIAQLQARDC